MSYDAQLSQLIEHSQFAVMFVAYFVVGIILCAAWWLMHSVMPTFAKAVLGFAILFGNAFILLPLMTNDAPTLSHIQAAMFFGLPLGFLMAGCVMWFSACQAANKRKQTDQNSK